MYIPYSVDKLRELSEKSAFDFAIMIEENKWLNYIYTGDWTHNDRLQFIRIWWYTKWRKTKDVKEKIRTDKKGQLKLL